MGTIDRYKRGMRAALGLAAAVSMTVFGTGTALAQAPAASEPTPAQKAEAIAEPSVVFIQTEWTGWLMNGELADVLSETGTGAPQFTVTTTCTGFIANPEGYIVTAGHCVDNQSMEYGGKGLIIQAAVSRAVDEGYIRPRLADDVVKYGYANWRVEGKDSGSPPDRVVGVFPSKAAFGTEATNPIPATVTDYKPFNQGDVALLKVQTDDPMPALEVSPEAAADGAAVVALGYPGSVSDVVDASSEPSMKDGTVSGSRTVGGVPFTEISAATSPGMSGGPVVDTQGRVVGTVSWTPGAETQPFNFITATSAIRELLGSHSVTNTLSATDKAYRAGLADYFAGRYHASAKKFNQVLAAVPDHAMAERYLRLATTNFPNEKTKKTEPKDSSSNTWMFVLIGVGALVLLGGAGGFFVMRRRRGRGPTGAPTAGPSYAGQASGTAAPMAASPPTAGVSFETGQPVTTEPTVPLAGQPVAEPVGHYCPLCGTPHDPQAHFCESCGFHFPSRVTHEEGGSTS